LVRRSLSLLDAAAKELGLVDGLGCLVVLLALLRTEEVSALAILVGGCIKKCWILKSLSSGQINETNSSNCKLDTRNRKYVTGLQEMSS
jgi:hypothetical protein